MKSLFPWTRKPEANRITFNRRQKLIELYRNAGVIREESKKVEAQYQQNSASVGLHIAFEIFKEDQ